MLHHRWELWELVWELVEACCLPVVAWELEDQVVQVVQAGQEGQEGHLPSGAAGTVHQTLAPPTKKTTTTMEQAKTTATVAAMTMAMDRHLSVEVLTRTPMPHLQT